MAGHDAGTQHQFTGFVKTTSTATLLQEGENCVLATYDWHCCNHPVFKLKPKKQKQITAK
uniref:Uncharacterized protein n=1 Tax=Anguilla anguilla TaxID=7936 RepID=A0A0E9VUN9_ANGAN